MLYGRGLQKFCYNFGYNISSVYVKDNRRSQFKMECTSLHEITTWKYNRFILPEKSEITQPNIYSYDEK